MRTFKVTSTRSASRPGFPELEMEWRDAHGNNGDNFASNPQFFFRIEMAEACLREETPCDRPRFRPRSENKVLLSFFFLSLSSISLLLASRWTLYARRVSCQRSRHDTFVAPLSLSLSFFFPLLLSLLSPLTSVLPLPSVVQHDDILFFFSIPFFLLLSLRFTFLFTLLFPATLLVFQFSFLTHSLTPYSTLWLLLFSAVHLRVYITEKSSKGDL